jgi:type III restriction enzyme
MSSLHEVLAERVQEWKRAGFPSQEHPAISELLEFAILEDGSPRFLRWPQIQALQTYWYLRLVEKTPHIFTLYQKFYPTPTELLDSLGLYSKEVQQYVINHNIDALWEHIRSDDGFSRENKLEALRETLRLEYPSYIFALAMGAGKTILIGSIIATEFAMALEYPRGPFVQNALVFAPGKTILESLRQLAEIPFDKILPPRAHKPFAASVKLTFTRDGEKDLPVVRGSIFNVVVTNTEKIRIQKPTGSIGKRSGFFTDEKQEHEEEIANLRIQAVASLPHLAVFSDEAHHTYGQALDVELKKVRKTVDYLNQNTNLLCVVNTTGTPYYQRQPLKDVVIWYGLSQGIRDNILKEVAGNVFSFDFDDANTDQFVSHVIRDFFTAYSNVALPNGAPARLAIYFPQTDDLADLRSVVDTTLAEIGVPASVVLEHTSKTPQANEDAFNRLAHDPTAPHRVILLVNKGTEGWDCPSLFACALARKLRSSNNFVLQAASRCLRQIPGNRIKARIYLAGENESTLDKQLQETYGEKLADFKVTKRQRGVAKLVVRKLNLPPLVVRKVIRGVERKNVESSALSLTRPQDAVSAVMVKRAYEFSPHLTGRRLLRETDEQEVDIRQETLDLYAAAVELSAVFHLDPWEIHGKLRDLYTSEAEIPLTHLDALAMQIEAQCRSYEIREETVEQALALVKLDGFTKELADSNTEIYTAEITYPLDKENLLAQWEGYGEDSGHFGFHYSPYNFDSEPEKDFFDQLLAIVSESPTEIEDIYFTGALTDPKKSDFRVEYRGEDGRWHDYTPDFVIRRKDGRCLIVEIKSAQFEAATEEDRKRAAKGEAVLTVEGRKAMALQRWVDDNSQRLQYDLIFAKSAPIPFNKIKTAKQFVEKSAES